LTYIPDGLLTLPLGDTGKDVVEHIFDAVNPNFSSSL